MANYQIAALCTDTTTNEQLHQAVIAGVRYGELRIDLCQNVSIDLLQTQIQRLQSCGLQVIATTRTTGDGGRFTVADNLEHYCAIIRSSGRTAELVDIEYNVFTKNQTGLRQLISAVAGDTTQCIISYHDFTQTPKLAALRAICAQACAAGADIIKIATMPHCQADLITLTTLLIQAQQPIIVIALGNLGKFTRVTFPLLGSQITFGYIDQQYQVSGQFSAKQLVKYLHDFSSTEQ